MGVPGNPGPSVYFSYTSLPQASRFSPGVWEYRGDRTSPKQHTEYGTRGTRAKRFSRERADGFGFRS